MLMIAPQSCYQGGMPVRSNLLCVCALVASIAVALPGAHGAQAQAGEGWYYPAPEAVEAYRPQTAVAAESDRNRRVAFVTNVTNFLLQQFFAPRYAFIAAGTEATELIVVELSGDFPRTAYFARVALESMSAVVRATNFAQQLGLEHELTFLDLANLLGFDAVVFTDADRFAYRVTMERP